MKTMDIAQLRLQNTGLSNSPCTSPADVVAHLGAVQSQNFYAALWAVGLRMQNATQKTVEDAFNKGKFLRTHVMRPTWHFVLPEDVEWMQRLTAPRVKKILAPYDLKLAITKDLLSKSQSVIEKALHGNNSLTRAELASLLEENKILARGQRLGHLIMHAELDALICSGPRRGKQFTYGLLKERAPKSKVLDREEALVTLALNYFGSHGPAQIGDFAWWSGLSSKEANEGLALAESSLATTTLDGKNYWFSPANEQAKQNLPITQVASEEAFLLSIYDEYTIAYKDRSALGDGRYVERLVSMGNALTAVIILAGKVEGTWKRVLKKNAVEIKLNPFRKFSADEQAAVQKASKRYGEFLRMEVFM